MNRKIIVSLFLVANAMVALSLAQNHSQQSRLTSITVDDGTQPPVPPPGVAVLIADGTQSAVPPRGRTNVTLLDDGTQPPVPPPGVAVLIADGTQPPVPPPGRLLEMAAALTAL
ncbi:MAG: hypothetical protein WA673_07850 [Candidatus Acidiferrales bacterium]